MQPIAQSLTRLALVLAFIAVLGIAGWIEGLS